MKFLYSLLTITALGIALPAGAEDAQGQWSGTIANTLPVVLDVSKTPEGNWLAVLSTPTQAFSSMVEQFESDGTHLSFKLDRLKAGYQATWDEQAKAWNGTWTQGQTVALNLHRTDAASVAALKPRRPQEAAIAAATPPYAAQEVRFGNAEASLKLAGSLLLPKGAGPWPAVVLVHGSGPNTRDEDVFGHKIFLVLADHLARQGIAVLRYDKRGIGGSTGDYKSATTLDFASDAQAAVAFLRTLPEVDARHIGMIGHSEGGLIAPMVAARDPQLGFVVMLAGPGVRGELLLPEQMALGAEAEGTSAAIIARQREMHRALFAEIVAERDPQQARLKATAILAQGERDGLVLAGSVPAQVSAFTSPWFQTFFRLEPGAALRAMRQPVLALNGALDRQVPSRLDLDAIRVALASNPHAVVQELPKLNHLFQTATTGAVGEYVQIEETLAPSALQVISDWVGKQVR